MAKQPEEKFSNLGLEISHARILVVDDEPSIREVLAEFLQMEGFEITVAENGQAALTEISKGHFDLVLSDLKMPIMGGLELLGHVKTQLPEALFIMMTGFGTVETAIEAMKNGAYDYILKPFKMEEVVHSLSRALESKFLQEQNLRLKEALSLYKVSEAIASSLSLDEVVETLVHAAIHEVGVDRFILILENGKGGFEERVQKNNAAFESAVKLGSLSISSIQSEIDKNRFVLAQKEQCLVFFEVLPEGMQTESLVVTPLKLRNQTAGYLCGLSFTPGKRFSESQRKLFTVISNRAAASIENANLYEDLQATFKQTIRGLASAIDKMDRYTAGHSERVADYAAMIATKLGLADKEIEIVRQSALMHDIGKIGCVMNLNKPGKLSEDEYEMFKDHPGYGRDILEPIEFLHPLIPGVYMHHERWDGHGYPTGKKGADIPLMARIISVADTYDAMTSNRAYRRALPHQVAVTEIENCSASQFDPEVAKTFVHLIATYRTEQRDQGKQIPE